MKTYWNQKLYWFRGGWVEMPFYINPYHQVKINYFFISLPPDFFSVLEPCTRWCASTLGLHTWCSLALRFRVGSDLGLVSRHDELRAFNFFFKFQWCLFGPLHVYVNKYSYQTSCSLATNIRNNTPLFWSLIVLKDFLRFLLCLVNFNFS